MISFLAMVSKGAKVWLQTEAMWYAYIMSCSEYWGVGRW